MMFTVNAYNESAWHRFATLPGTVCLAVNDPDHKCSIMIHVSEASGQIVRLYRSNTPRRLGKIKRAMIEDTVSALWAAEQMGVPVRNHQPIELPFEIMTREI